MEPLYLIAVGIAGVLLLLLAVIKFKIPAFIALLFVSLMVALVAGIPLQEIVTTVQSGMGGTLGSVALLVGLGAMLGRIIEVSGGAEALATRFTAILGPRRIIAALTAAAFLLAIPVFFDVGFIILVPIIYGFAKIIGANPVKVGLPIAGVMLTLHVVVPPHPGIVGASGVLGADIGWVTLLAFAICLPLGFIAYTVARWINRRDFGMLPATRKEFLAFGSGQERFGAAQQPREGQASEESQAGQTQVSGAGQLRTSGAEAPPAPGMIIALIVLPILMILLGTVGAVVVPQEAPVRGALALIGSPLVALLVALALAYYFLGIRRGWTVERTGEVLESALAPTAIVILVTGAGGVFGRVLTESGVGRVLADSLAAVGLPVVVSGFLLSAVLRISQGSATVAIITSAGLLSTAVADGGFSPVQIALITIAVGFGALGFSHVKDSGFWIVTRYLGLSVADGLRSWTVLTTTLGLFGFLLTMLLWFSVTGVG